MVTALAIATLPSPDGPFHLAVSERGVVAADVAGDRSGFEAGLRRRFAQGGGVVIEAVLRGEPVAQVATPLDLHDRPAFDRAVLHAVQDVPWGRTASYGEIARRVGTPRAARAVGGAVGRNPVARLVPCHRIIAADGTLGGYGGDGPGERNDALDLKAALLRREGVIVPRRDR